MAIIQFQNQLLAVESPTPRERMGSGNISPITTHAQGPQVDANESNHRRDSGFVSGGSFVLADCDADNSNEVLRNDHSGAAEDEQVSSTKFLLVNEGVSILSNGGCFRRRHCLRRES
jgi:uncharacterized heparinase superfamily protein